MKRGGWIQRKPKPAPRRPPLHASGIRPAQRILVLLRDGSHCRACGCWVANIPSSIQHRLPRGRGGTDRLSNLILVCGTATTLCHGYIESDRTQAYVDGFSLHTGTEGDNPEAVPILTADGWRHFLDDGSVLTRDEYATGRAS